MKLAQRLGGVLAVAALVAGSACSSGDSTGVNNTPGSITLALSNGTLSIAQGTNGSVTATITRVGSFTGAVNIAVSGLPANVTAAANPTSIPAGSTISTITFTAAAAAATGNSTITITASGSGVADRTATLTLTVTAASAGSFTVALNPTTLSIPQGNQNASTATLTRTGGFAGNVTFSATGAPSGMTVTFNPASTTQNTTTVTVAVGAAVAANTYPVVIHGVSGSIDQTATLSVTVTPSGGGGGSTTFRVCGQVPVFAAYQDGTGNWTAATITNGAWSFNLNSGRGGVAWVIANANSFTTNVQYGTQAELNNGAFTCTTAAPGTKTVTGSVANVGQTEIATVTLGTALAFVIPIASSNFTLTNVSEGTIDLLAVRGSQTGASIVANKFIARRGLTPATGSTLPVLDFNAAEAQNLVSRNVTINGLAGGETTVIQEAFMTSRGSSATLFTESGSSAATRPVPAVGTTQAGDLHFLQVIAGSGTLPFTQYRGILAYMQNSNAQTFTLGPQVGTVTVTAAATSPSVRLRAQYTIQPEYSRGANILYTQTSGTTTRSVYVTASAGYLNSTNFDVTMPELNGLTGWQAIWQLLTGTAVQWTFSAANFTGTGQILDGLTLTVGVRSGQITP